MEATQLVANGGALSIKTADALVEAFNFLSEEENYKRASGAAYQYIEQNSGATAVILKEIQKNLLI